MIEVEETVDIARDRAMVYERWLDVESLPRFMEAVKSVRRLDDTHTHWVAEVAGHRREWDAEITQQVPGKMVSWKSVGGSGTSGTVWFEPLPQATRVTVRVEYEPQGLAEQASELLGVFQGRVRRDLERFREELEGDDRSPRAALRKAG
jgi:uncharacterized membrane protein